MANRATQGTLILTVNIDNKSQELKVEKQATDRDSIWLQGNWDARRAPRPIWARVSNQAGGTFRRQKDQNRIFAGAFTLLGVDSMHGLAYGGQGTALFDDRSKDPSVAAKGTWKFLARR